MKDEGKTKEQLVNELVELRQRVAELEAGDAERVRVEEKLRESERQLESRERFITSILDSIPTSLVVIDRSQRVVSANRNFLEKTRQEEQATLGCKIEEVFPQVLVRYTRLNQKVREVFHTGKPVEGGRLAYRAPSLPTRIYYYRLIPLYLSPSREGEEGAVENLMLLMDDITEREQLEEEVRRTERHLASVVDSAYDLVASMDAEGRILTWNKAAERTSGLRPEEVKGQYLPSLCVKENQQEMGAWLAQLAKGRFTKKSVEINLRTKEGEEVPISWTGSRMLDDEHRIVGLVAVGRDLTERKRLEAQLIQSAKLTSLGVMAGGIAHEIRNPLAISSAAAQLLMKRPDDEKLRKEAAEKIHSGIQRASYIIENLLKFARPPEERMVSVDVSEVLEETLSLLANQLRVQRVDLRRDFASDLPPVVGNESLLQQVFSNMILNACNAMPDGGSLAITTKVGSDNQVEIAFADTGCGIPDDNLGKIFDPFFTTMPVGKGVGLGLSISYSIVQQHQGTIEAANQAGQGSIFTIRLPVAEGRD
jgi:PAS domain S-box-containing protein